jgi:hypothetical protein
MSLQYLRRTVDPVNQYRRWIDPLIRALELAEITAYLEKHGWHELPPDRPALRAFQEPRGAVANGKPICQFVPASEENDDYPQRMFELLTGLAEFENRQAAEIIDEILRLPPWSQRNGERGSSLRQRGGRQVIRAGERVWTLSGSQKGPHATTGVPRRSRG